MSKECPVCRLLNPDTALQCDCGYGFPSTGRRSRVTVDEIALFDDAEGSAGRYSDRLPASRRTNAPVLTRRQAVLAAAVGLGWGLVGAFFANLYGRSGLWGALTVSTVIGVAMATAARTLPPSAGNLVRWLWAGAGLYAAVVLFQFALLVGGGAGGNLAKAMSNAVRGATLFLGFGWVVLLWPLAFLSHMLFWPTDSADRRR